MVQKDSLSKHEQNCGVVKMRVLLIEDDARTAKDIEQILKSQSFQVYTTDLGEEGLDLAKLYDYNIIVLDLGLPDISGFEVLRSLRTAKVKTPVIILSGLSSIEDKVKGLNLGADDYMTKPFHKDELVARINAIVRRSRGHTDSVIQLGCLSINISTRTVRVNGTEAQLTRKEYELIAALFLHRGQKLSREMLLDHIYGGIDEPDYRTIDVFVGRIRRKLGTDCIVAVRGYGYMLKELEEVE